MLRGEESPPVHVSGIRRDTRPQQMPSELLKSEWRHTADSEVRASVSPLNPQDSNENLECASTHTRTQLFFAAAKAPL